MAKTLSTYAVKISLQAQDFDKNSGKIVSDMNRMNRAIGLAQPTLANLSDGLKALWTSVKTERSLINHAIANPLGDAAKQADKAVLATRATADAVVNLGRSFAAAQVRAAAFWAVAIGPLAVAGGLAGMARSSEKFQQELQRGFAIAQGENALDDKMKGALRDQAIKVSFETGVDVNTVAASYKYLFSAGLNAEQSIGVLGITTEFANAAMMNAATATDMLTDAQSALGMTSKDASINAANMQRISDVLVMGNQLATVSVQQLGEALAGGAATAARTYGRTLEETVGLLASFGSMGIKGSEAGTAVQIVMRELVKSQAAASAGWQKYGISLYDAAGKMNNVATIIGQLEKALDGLSDQQRMKVIRDELGFEAKSQKYVLSLVGNPVDPAWQNATMLWPDYEWVHGVKVGRTDHKILAPFDGDVDYVFLRRLGVNFRRRKFRMAKDDLGDLDSVFFTEFRRLGMSKLIREPLFEQLRFSAFLLGGLSLRFVPALDSPLDGRSIAVCIVFFPRLSFGIFFSTISLARLNLCFSFSSPIQACQDSRLLR